jgi:D-alanyl-D-alanine carboxypeptidase
MAIVAQALYRDFPEHEALYGIGALRLGSQVIPTHNGLMGRYPGAEGMKTGFTCPAGFNVVASATRGGRRLIAVVLGYPSAKSRTLKAASLLDMGFAGRSSGPQVASLPDAGGSPPNMRTQICTAARQEPTEDDYAVPVVANAQGSSFSDPDSPAAFFASDGHSSGATLTSGVAAIQAQMATRPYFEPIPVFIGRAPGYAGPVVGARDSGARPVGSAVTAAIAAKAAETAKAERDAKAKARVEARVEARAKPPPAPVKASIASKRAKPAEKAAVKAKPEPKVKAEHKAKPVKTAGKKADR